jgi:hypothetical protein
MVLTVNGDYFLNRINQLIFVMVKCSVLFEVRTEFLNNIYTSFDFNGLNATLSKCVQTYKSGEIFLLMETGKK